MSPKLRFAIKEAADKLRLSSDTPDLDAELLMAHAMGIERDVLLLSATDPWPSDVFVELVNRRMSGEPIAYILGYRDFWTVRLAVGPDVLIPRPDSETLIEAARSHFQKTAGPKRVLDLGTGSGALLFAAMAEWPSALGTGVDRSAGALAIATANADQLGFLDRVALIEGGWAGTGEMFDLILCNPPYVGTGETLPHEVIGYEPSSALFAGADGLDDYRALAPLLPKQLAEGGIICLEVGATQAQAVTTLMEKQGLLVQICHDLGGRERCLAMTR